LDMVVARKEGEKGKRAHSVCVRVSLERGESRPCTRSVTHPDAALKKQFEVGEQTVPNGFRRGLGARVSERVRVGE
jgi:hypothetical protein